MRSLGIQFFHFHTKTTLGKPRFQELEEFRRIVCSNLIDILISKNMNSVETKFFHASCVN